MSSFIAEWLNPGSLQVEKTPPASEPEGLDDVLRDASIGALNRAGVRLWRDGDAWIIGIWSDLDSEKIRTALRCLKLDGIEVRQLEMQTFLCA